MSFVSVLSFICLLAFPQANKDAERMSCDIKPYTAIKEFRRTIDIAVPENLNIVKVEMYVNSMLSDTDTDPPYSLKYDKDGFNGDGELLFVGYDAANKQKSLLRIPIYIGFPNEPLPTPESNDKSPKRYPELEKLSLGFTEKDIASIEQKYLKDGFVILNNSEGKPIYELSVRFDEGSLKKTLLSRSHIYMISFSVENSFLIGANRPTGVFDGTIPLSAIDALLARERFRKPEQALNEFVRRLPAGFLPSIVESNLAAKCSKIEEKRTNGDYLSASDAEADIREVKLYLLDTLNSALVSCKTNVFPEFQFERPLVHMRNLVKEASISPVKAMNAVRVLNSNGLLAKLYGYDPSNSSFAKNSLPLDTTPFVNRIFGSSAGSVSALKVAPYPAQEGLRALNAVRSFLHDGELMETGSIRWGMKHNGQFSKENIYRP